MMSGMANERGRIRCEQCMEMQIQHEVRLWRRAVAAWRAEGIARFPSADELV